MKKITFIGAGNVATILSSELKRKGFEIVEVWSKTEQSAIKLANKLSCNYSINMTKLKETDLFIVCVKDDFIKEVIDFISCYKVPVVHTSGSVDFEIFNTENDYGVFYPLQSFNKDIDISFKEIPICIEANTTELERDLLHIANTISNSVQLLNSEQRRQLHIAAVFASNFSNHMISISEKLMEENDMDFDLLKPLIENTFFKIKSNSPRKIQTGPAIREDYKVIEKHLALLKNKDDLKIIYSKISNHIKNNNFNE